jgi:hypothetical protein
MLAAPIGIRFHPVPLQSERATMAVPSQLQRDMLQQVPAATSLVGNGKRRCANRAGIYKLLGKIDLRWAPR